MTLPLRLLLIVLFINFSTSMAQQNPPVRKDLLAATVNQKVSVVEIKEINIGPGQAAPQHLHPSPVVGYVVKGSVLFQVEGQEAVILKAGDAFYEPKNKTVLHFDNAAKNEPVTFVAFYLKKADEDNIRLLNVRKP